MHKITYDFSKSTVSYDPETGEFRWVICYRKPWMDGEIATHPGSHGYLYIKADGKNHSASRLAWSLINGRPVPKFLEVDHINRINNDNCEANLRAVTEIENKKNMERSIGRSGIRGVRIYNRPNGNGNLWRMTVDGVTKYFTTLDEAAGYATLVADRCTK